jgi:DNA adenine methylase
MDIFPRRDAAEYQNKEKMKITRPVLRYPGGKYKLAKWINSHFPQHGVYVEPYGGAGSVLMAKPRAQGEVFNDLDGDVVNVFRVLREPKQAKKLERLLRLTPFAYEEYKRAYEPCKDKIERAMRTIFRSFATIGSDGVSRRNSGFRGLKNNGTSVTAAQEWARYPEAIEAFVGRMRFVLIEQRPALQVIKLYDRMETLFYVDPPYVMSTRSRSSVLYTNEMSEEEHVELAKALHQAKGMVVLSGYPSALYDELYAGWMKVMKSTTAQNGKRRVECLWLSPNIKTRMF